MSALFFGLALPFLGTTLGAATVFFLKGKMNDSLERGLLGFAAGVMVAASVWSLLIPAMDMSASLGRLAFAPALAGFAAGIAFLFLLDKITPHLHAMAQKPEGPAASISRTTMLFFAVTLHNIPEGMAVGVALASFLSGGAAISAADSFALALGIAIQNFPEGAIVSMPLLSEGKGKGKAFRARLSQSPPPLRFCLRRSCFPCCPTCFLSRRARWFTLSSRNLFPKPSATKRPTFAR